MFTRGAEMVSSSRFGLRRWKDNSGVKLEKLVHNDVALNGDIGAHYFRHSQGLSLSLSRTSRQTASTSAS